MMNLSMGLLVLLLVYVAGHAAVLRLSRAGLELAGLEYLAIGVLAGPLVLDLPITPLVEQLGPVLAIALGLLGLMLGLRFRFRALAEIRPDAFQGALILAATTLVLAVGAVLAALVLLFDLHDVHDLLPPAIALGAAAIPSSSRLLATLVRTLRASGFMSELVTATSWLTELLSILLFGMLFCVFHQGQLGSMQLPRPLTSVEWAALNVTLGLALGLAWSVLLGNERRSEWLVVDLGGITLLTSAIAYHLSLSPLLMSLLAGMAMANLSPARDRLRDLASAMGQPLVPTLGFFAGVLFVPPPLEGLALAGLYLVARLAARLLSGRLISAASAHPAAATRAIGRGFVSQGALPIAMAIGYIQIHPGAVGATVLTTLVLSALVAELPAGRLARDLLVDAGDIPLERRPEPEAPEGGTA